MTAIYEQWAKEISEIEYNPKSLEEDRRALELLKIKILNQMAQNLALIGMRSSGIDMDTAVEALRRANEDKAKGGGH